MGFLEAVQIQRHAIGHGTQGLGIHDAAQAIDHGFGQLVFTRQLSQCVAGQCLRIGPTCVQTGILQCDTHQKSIQGGLVFDVLLFFANLDFVQRRLRDINVPTLYQFGHLTIEESEQQGTDVRAVDVGIGHDDDAVITQFVNVEVVRA